MARVKEAETMVCDPARVDGNPIRVEGKGNRQRVEGVMTPRIGEKERKFRSLEVWRVNSWSALRRGMDHSVNEPNISRTKTLEDDKDTLEVVKMTNLGLSTEPIGGDNGGNEINYNKGPISPTNDQPIGEDIDKASVFGPIIPLGFEGFHQDREVE
ncbi:hypothetical protein PIB30_076650 [Stylosanthes scabra]|uniref:Uncharacterized protein n=1 Tax=Stylosanthes scabra TaxID=79078 RepID=A0ABU6WNK9_9FABA|nr:hypothetical protein [Stylosanthes scabra]